MKYSGKSDEELSRYIENLFQARESAYESSSKYIINTQSGNLVQVIDDILGRVEFEDCK